MNTGKTPSKLDWKVFVTPAVPTVSDDLPPGESVRMWSPVSSTLILGEREAVLVDTPTTEAQAEALADWVASFGKRLTTIYATHGHGDHFFGNGVLLSRFPDARAIATPKVIDVMRRQVSPQMRAAMWDKRFPGQLPSNIVFPEPLNENGFYLEDQELVVVDVGHTDTDDCTCLYVPSASLVVAGDIVYNGVHQYFGESETHEKRMQWIAALDKVNGLTPKVVIAGHKAEAYSDDPSIIESTRKYILDFDRLIERTATTLELYNAMLEVYPRHLNRGALWGSARTVKG